MSRSVVSGARGHWHPGAGSHPADTGYAGPRGTEGVGVSWEHVFAGELRPRGNTQGADPTIKDAAHRENVLLHPKADRYGPAGKVQVGRSYSAAMSHTDTGRNVKILPSAKGNTDFRRVGDGDA